MNSKFINCTLIAILVSLCYSCAFNPTRAEVSYANDTINVSNVSSNNTVISISVCGKKAIDTLCTSSLWFSILDAIDKSSLDKIELAAYATEHNNTLPVQVKIGKQVDSLGISLSPYFPKQINSSIEGICAPLIPKLLSPDRIVNVKRWLFKHKKRFSDEDINNVLGIYNRLSSSAREEYITTNQIPVINTYSDISYKVKSGVQADYYILFACSNIKDVDELLEVIISNNFTYCTTTLNNPMHCYSKRNTSGYQCICLVAINKDWNYQIEPLAWVAIDDWVTSEHSLFLTEINYAAQNLSFNDIFNYEPTIMRFSNGKTALPPLVYSDIFGYANVELLRFKDTGTKCNCTFEINYEGDVKSVTIIREKNLAKWLTEERKVIELNGKNSPYTFTYDLQLEEGDNIIPIEIEDYHGNVLNKTIIVKATSSN